MTPSIPPTMNATGTGSLVPAGSGIGIFTTQELDRLVRDTVPANRTHAVVGSVNQDGIQVVVKMQLKEHWEVEAAVEREWGGNIQAGAKVVWSW